MNFGMIFLELYMWKLKICLLPGSGKIVLKTENVDLCLSTILSKIKADSGKTF